MNYPPPSQLVTIQNSSDFIISNLNKKGREQHEQFSGIACGFSHVNFLLFSVVSFFSQIFLCFFITFLLILISLWYYIPCLHITPPFHITLRNSVYFLVSIQRLDHCSLSLFLSLVSLFSVPFSVHNLIQLRVWCQFYFYTLFRRTRPCLERFQVKFRRSRDAPAHERTKTVPQCHSTSA